MLPLLADVTSIVPTSQLYQCVGVSGRRWWSFQNSVLEYSVVLTTIIRICFMFKLTVWQSCLSQCSLFHFLFSHLLGWSPVKVTAAAVCKMSTGVPELDEDQIVTIVSKVDLKEMRIWFCTGKNYFNVKCLNLIVKWVQVVSEKLDSFLVKDDQTS